MDLTDASLHCFVEKVKTCFEEANRTDFVNLFCKKGQLFTPENCTRFVRVVLEEYSKNPDKFDSVVNSNDRLWYLFAKFFCQKIEPELYLDFILCFLEKKETGAASKFAKVRDLSFYGPPSDTQEKLNKVFLERIRHVRVKEFPRLIEKLPIIWNPCDVYLLAVFHERKKIMEYVANMPDKKEKLNDPSSKEKMKTELMKIKDEIPFRIGELIKKHIGIDVNDE